MEIADAASLFTPAHSIERDQWMMIECFRVSTLRAKGIEQMVNNSSPRITYDLRYPA